MLPTIRFLTVFVALLAAVGVDSHSWIDDLVVVGGSAPTGKKGFIRNYQGHTDLTASYRINALGEDAIFGLQSSYMNYPNPLYPRLKARPGDYVMGTYLENGHISKDEAPTIPGNTWWFLINNTAPLKIDKVIQWTKGPIPPADNARLLSGPIPYDDGVCIEANETPKSKARIAAGGGGPCKSTFKIPEDVPIGKAITVMWVWDFSGKLGPDKVHFEWYTSTADIEIVADPTTAKAVETPPIDAAKSDPKRLKPRMVSSAKFRRHLSGFF